ncbi:MAG: hypothetical protein MUE30_02220 [Spirosomaceae bacterium]|jgi:hypothetical protein|nr:hypothetical protein [Spirosomataceae bacterium]
MGYSQYRKLNQVTTKFALADRRADLFGAITPIEPSSWLTHSLAIAEEVALNNEKVKSERIISPILSEVHLMHKTKVALYSGEELNVSPENDLNGPCDFFFSANPESYQLSAPIVAFAEAKDEDMEWGIAQCCAQMYAASLFNQANNRSIKSIFGCVTTGSEWRFIKLEDQTIYIHSKAFYLDQVAILLGVFHQIINQIKQIQ